MTNLFKRFFTHKSKFLLIIISLLGLAFSYSCTCRNPNNPNPNPDPTPKGDSSIFSITEAENNNNLLIYSSAANRTNSQLIVKFNEQAGNTFKATIAIEDDGGTGLKAENFTYNETTGKLDLTSDGITTVSSLTPKETKTVKIKFSFTPDTSGLEIKTPDFTTDIQFVKTKLIIPKDTFPTILKKVNGGGLQPNTSTTGKKNPSFAFEFGNDDGSGTKFTVKTTGSDDVGTIKRVTFKGELNDKIKVMDEVNINKNSDFSKIEVIDDGVINGKIATFTLKFTPVNTVELDAGDGTYKLDADLNNAGGDSKWE